MVLAMSDDERNRGQQSRLRLQFSLLAVLGLVTGCGVVLGLVLWIGPDLVGSCLMIGGFALVLLGSSLGRERLVVCGGAAMMAACIVLVVLAIARVVFS